MSMRTTFTCDLCRRILLPDGQPDAGLALRWDTDDHLEPCRWVEAPIHLCLRCINEVAKHAQSPTLEGGA